MRLFDPVFSNPPLLLLSQTLGVTLHMLSLVCIARGFFFWEVHVIRTVQAEGQGSCSLIGQSEE
ncbi:unnamed protein product, partial [Staurois parvus]